jgi:hypothetical protein
MAVESSGRAAASQSERSTTIDNISTYSVIAFGPRGVQNAIDGPAEPPMPDAFGQFLRVLPTMLFCLTLTGAANAAGPVVGWGNDSDGRSEAVPLSEAEIRELQSLGYLPEE